MEKSSNTALRTIDTAKLFSLLEGRLDEETRLRVAAAVAEACGHGGVSCVLSSSGLGRAALGKVRREIRERLP